MLKAETEVTRTNIFGDGAKITPLKKYGINAFGQTVTTDQSPDGCEIPTASTIPAFIDPMKVFRSIKLYDNRGLVVIEQDPLFNQTGFTYTPNGKAARILRPTSYFVPTSDIREIKESKDPRSKVDRLKLPDATFSTARHLDEERFTYHDSNQFNLAVSTVTT